MVCGICVVACMITRGVHLSWRVGGALGSVGGVCVVPCRWL